MDVAVSKVIGAAFALASAACAGRAAKYSGAAGQVPLRPPWKDPTLEPGDEVASLQGWNAATLEAGREAGGLNAKAAEWSTWSARLAVLAAAVGLLT
jgi:hypothetical protein